MRARVHNAKAATHDGTDCWIASITDHEGRPSCIPNDVQEFDDEFDAIGWATARLRLHKAYPLCIDLDDGSVLRPDLPRKKSR